MPEVEVIKAKNVLSNQSRGKNIERLRVAAYCRVSTDSEDQLNSYKSQVQYYTDLINKNVEWIFAGIYADEGISGTNTKKRDEFKRMIMDSGQERLTALSRSPSPGLQGIRWTA